MSTPEDVAARPDEVADAIDIIITIRANGLPCDVQTSFLEGIKRRFTAQRATIKRLERERDEALMLTESCSSLSEMASACVAGARLIAQLRHALDEMLERYGPPGLVKEIPYPKGHPITLARDALRAALSPSPATREEPNEK